MLIYLQTFDIQGDREKFEKLYLCYRSYLYRVALQILHNQADAEDAVHQTFLYILGHLEKIGEVDSPQTRSFVVICCRSNAIDILRKRNRNAETPMEGFDPPVREQGDDGALAEAFGRLPPHYREYLLLRYVHGYSTREIAEMTRKNYEAVKKTITKAKAMLQKLLREVGEDE